MLVEDYILPIRTLILAPKTAFTFLVCSLYGTYDSSVSSARYDYSIGMFTLVYAINSQQLNSCTLFAPKRFNAF